MPEAHWHEWRRLEAVVNLAFSRHNVVGGVRLRPAHAHRRDGRRPVRHPPRRSGAAASTGTTTATRTRSSSSASTWTPRRTRWRRTPRPRSSSTRHRPLPARPSPDSPPDQQLPAQEIENMVLATHEVVSNAHLHGRPPVVLRLWVLPGRLTVTVTDTGPGPTDPFVGLLPPDTPNGVRARPVDQPPTRRHDPPPPPRRLHRPPDRKRFVPVRRGARPLRAWTRRAVDDAPLSADPAAPGSRRRHPPSRPSATPVRGRERGPRPRSRRSSGACPAGTGSTGLRCRCSAGR